MIQEILYTSAPKGLKPGSHGFCTVLSTQGMTQPVATALEALSGYRPVTSTTGPDSHLNPVVYSHLKLPLAGRRSHVLSRIAAYGLDYSQRSNKIAHHLVLDAADQSPAGPAWLLMQSGVMREHWDGELKVVAGNRSLPQTQLRPDVCHAWKELTGDAGWAGVLAESFLKGDQQTAYLIISPGMNVLPLIAEAIALLPPDKRWEVTFSTYFTKIPNGATCHWRCVLSDSAEANESRRFVRSLRLDLTKPLGMAPSSPLVTAARTGRISAESLQTQLHGEMGGDARENSLDSDETEESGETYAVTAPPPVKGRSRHSARSTASVRQSKSPIILFATVTLLVLAGGVGGAFWWMQSSAPATEEPPVTSHEEVVPSENLVETNAPVAVPIPVAPDDSAEGSPVSEPQMANTDPQLTQTPTEKPTEEALMPPEGTPETAANLPADSQENAASPDQQMANDSPSSAEGDGGDAPAPAEPAVEVVPRTQVMHWESLEQDLAGNKTVQFELPAGFSSSGSQLQVWLPKVDDPIMHAKGSEIQQQDRLSEGEWLPYVKLSISPVDDQNQHIVLKSNSDVPYANLSRGVMTIQPEDPSLQEQIILLHGSMREPKKTRNGEQFDLFFPVVIPDGLKSWNLKLERLAFQDGEKSSQTIHHEEGEQLTWAQGLAQSIGSISSGTGIEIKLTDLLAPETMNLIQNKNFVLVEDLQIPILMSIRSGQDRTTNQTKLTEIQIRLQITTLEKRLYAKIGSRIEAASNQKEITVTFPKLMNSPPDPPTPVFPTNWIDGKQEFLSETHKQQMENYLKAVEECKMNYQTRVRMATLQQTGGRNANNSATIPTEDEQNQLIAALNNRIDQVEQLLSSQQSANELIAKLRQLTLAELEIHQECQNDDETRFLPVFVYRQQSQ